MDYQQGIKKSFEVKWKTTRCGQEDCWCLGIEPVEKITDDNGEQIYIAGGGFLPKEYAEYIVKIHNEKIDKKRFYATKKIKG